MWIFLDCLSVLLFPPVSYSVVLLQSVDYFCSSCRIIASFLASFALVRRLFLLFSSINRFSYRQFRFSPSIGSLKDLGGGRGKKVA